MKYNCTYCNYQSNHKGYYDRHLRSTKHLKNIENYEINKNSDDESEMIKPNIIFCDYCNKQFTNQKSKYRHINHLSCNKLPENIRKKIIKKINNASIKKINITTTTENTDKNVTEINGNCNNHININVNSDSNTIITNTTNNAINHTTNNIKFNVIGHESFNHIPFDRMMYHVRNIFSMPSEYINDKYNDPKNMNILFSNINSNYVKAYTKNQKWEFQDFQKIIGPIILRDLYQLYEIFETHEEKLKKCCTTRQLANFKHYYSIIDNKNHKNHKVHVKKLTSEYKIACLNYKDSLIKIINDINNFT